MSASRASPRLKKHQDMYKNATPPWKDVYRKRCHDRLRKSRESLISRFRKNQGEECSQSIVHDLMTEEWQALQMEQHGLPRLSTPQTSFKFSSVQDDNIENVMAVFEEIQQELMEKEQEILRQYEESMSFDEAALCATVQGLEVDDDVICPVCTKNSLISFRSVIFCKCGVRIDTAQDCIGLPYIKKQLAEAVNHHVCTEQPQFSVISQMGIENLVMTCNACDFMYIIV